MQTNLKIHIHRKKKPKTDKIKCVDAEDNANRP